MKKLALLALVSAPAFAAEVCTETDNSKYCENAAINKISITNDVDVYSSRQNVWICGAGIKSEGGSDNRLYYTKTTYRKGRDVLLSTSPKVLEAPATGTRAGQFVHATSANEKVFSKTRETRISDIRVELASLNYGAEIYVDICGELPFSYYDMPKDSRRNFLFNLKAGQMIHQIANLRSNEYVTEAGLEWTMEAEFADGWHGDQTSSKETYTRPYYERNSGNSSGLGIFETYDNMNHTGRHAYLKSGFNMQEIGKGEFFQAIPNASSSMNSHVVVEDIVSAWDHDNNLDKWVVRYSLKETSGEKRLKGLTEGLRWRQTIDSKLNIKSKINNREFPGTTE